MPCFVDDPIQTTLRDIAQLLERAQVRFVIIGGIAATLRGEPRLTADVDLIVGVELEEARALLNSLDRSQFRPMLADAQQVMEAAFLLPLRHVTTSIQVDLALGLTLFEQQVIERATLVELDLCSVPVATPEDLILLKLVAGRPRDIDDIGGIVSRQGSQLDWDYLFKMGAALQEAIAHDIIPHLNKLRDR